MNQNSTPNTDKQLSEKEELPNIVNVRDDRFLSGRELRSVGV